MTLTEAIVFIGVVIVLTIGLVRFLDFIEKDAKSTWWVIAEGIYIDSITKPIGSRIATGMTGYYVKLPPIVWTTLVFENGVRIKVIINIDELPPRGTKIKVLKNDRAEFKIETVKTA